MVYFPDKRKKDAACIRIQKPHARTANWQDQRENRNTVREERKEQPRAAVDRNHDLEKRHQDAARIIEEQEARLQKDREAREKDAARIEELEARLIEQGKKHSMAQSAMKDKLRQVEDASKQAASEKALA